MPGKSPFEKKIKMLYYFDMVDNTDQDSVSNLVDSLYDERSENFEKENVDFFGIPNIERTENED